MPCDTITTATVAIEKMNRDLLKAGLTDAGIDVVEVKGQIAFTHNYYRVLYDPATGKLTVRDRDAEEVKGILARSYSTAVVKSQAKKFGWQMKSLGQNRWQVVRR